MRRADHLSRGVLLTVVCLSVIVKPRYWGDHGPLGAVATWKKNLGGILTCFQNFQNFQNFQKNLQRKSKHTFYVQWFDPENRTVCEIMWKNPAEPGRPQITIWRMRISLWVLKATYTNSIVCNTYCCFAATMVKRTNLRVTLYVHCLSCSASHDCEKKEILFLRTELTD